MATKTIELAYTPELNRKIIHKAGVPGDNLPDNLMQFMCKHYDNNNIIEGKRILVIRMLDLAKQYAVKNRVTYITDNPEKYDEFLKAINNEQKYGGDDSVELIEDWKNIGELLKDMPKFDVVIGNPPYEGQGNPLYLQILEYCNKISKEIIWLCPSQWVKAYKDSNYLLNVKNNTCNNLIEHQHINNPFSDAGLANEVGIYHFGTSEKYESYEDLFFEKFGNKELTKSIINKFEHYIKIKNNLRNKNNVFNNEKYCVNGARVRGHFGSWDYTTLFGENQRLNFNINNKYANHWYFNTIEECKNFVKTCETDICEYAYFICKRSQDCNNSYFYLIPWLGDYTHEWTEEAIAKELNLTQEEVDYIHEEMKNFGWKAAPKKKE